MQWLASADTNLPKINQSGQTINQQKQQWKFLFVKPNSNLQDFFEDQAFSAFTNWWKTSWFHKKKQFTYWLNQIIHQHIQEQQQQQEKNITGLYILLHFLPAWADPRSCSPSAYMRLENIYVKIFQLCFKLSGWRFPSFYMFHVFSMSSLLGWQDGTTCRALQHHRLGSLWQPSKWCL